MIRSLKTTVSFSDLSAPLNVRGAAASDTKLGKPATPNLIQASQPKPPSRRMHRKQAASYLGVSLSWLDKSRLRGDGPAFLQIGGRVVYDTADLDSYLMNCRRQSTSEPG